MNCFNIYLYELFELFLVNRGRARVRARANPKSRLKKPGIVKPSLLGVSLSYIMASQRAKSLSGSLRAIKPCAGFF